jgi:hypothetical protein
VTGVSETSAGARRAAAATELLSAVRFQEELRLVTRYRSHPLVGDPLKAAVKKIEQNPAFSQSRLLTRILTALTHERGEFRRAEIATLDAETLFLVITLMDARAAGTSTQDDWVRAVDAAKTAELGAGG